MSATKMVVPMKMLALPHGKTPKWDLPVHTISGKRYVAFQELVSIDPGEHRLNEAQWNDLPFARDPSLTNSYLGALSLVLSEFNQEKAEALRKTWGRTSDPRSLGPWYMGSDNHFKGELHFSETEADYQTYNGRQEREYLWRRSVGLYVDFGREGSFNLLCNLVGFLGLPAELLDPYTGKLTNLTYHIIG